MPEPERPVPEPERPVPEPERPGPGPDETPAGSDRPAAESTGSERPRVEEPATPDSDDRPATAGDVRGLRRWLLVTAAWAVAATAIAVIALVVANRADDEEQQARTADRISDVRQDLNARIDEVESRIEQLPTSEDTSNLDDRLKQVEKDTSGTPEQLDRLAGRLDDLEQRVDGLEQQLEAAPGQTGTGAAANGTAGGGGNQPGP
jgi:outer membrane murein-binding lipoprotein Lpp